MSSHSADAVDVRTSDVSTVSNSARVRRRSLSPNDELPVADSFYVSEIVSGSIDPSNSRRSNEHSVRLSRLLRLDVNRTRSAGCALITRRAAAAGSPAAVFP